MKCIVNLLDDEKFETELAVSEILLVRIDTLLLCYFLL